jgi:hypothetical protein
MGLQTVALESSLSEAEPAAPFTFGNDPAKTFDDESFQSCPLSVG